MVRSSIRESVTIPLRGAKSVLRNHMMSSKVIELESAPIWVGQRKRRKEIN